MLKGSTEFHDTLNWESTQNQFYQEEKEKEEFIGGSIFEIIIQQWWKKNQIELPAEI